jgi:predicted subunit of tRNA(5-methylaminomethyl-2-thiouridylate) methyltransferase
MKHNNFSQNQNQKSARAPQAAAAAEFNSSATDFVPSPDEVARKAYFCYVNEGSQPGREVQHWLQAEAELIAERNRTRVHGFHNRT